MFDSTFVNLFTASTITLGDLLLCVFVALALGVGISLTYQFRNACSQSLAVTLVCLPPVVAVVIMMVGGNLGTGLAVAGTFSLVRFRSMPGTAREIFTVFLSTAVGLACGAGYPVIGAILAVVVCVALLVLNLVNFGGGKNSHLRKVLRVTVPEDLDYTGVFDDIFEEYTAQAKLVSVKTTNLGSLNKLSYEVTLKSAGTEKAMIDALRCRNGNLEISISTQEMNLRYL